jgi:hypothetical protein
MKSKKKIELGAAELANASGGKSLHQIVDGVKAHAKKKNEERAARAKKNREAVKNVASKVYNFDPAKVHVRNPFTYG